MLLPKVEEVIWPKGDAAPLEGLPPPLKMDLVVVVEEDENANGDFAEEELANEDSVEPVPACKNGEAWVAKLDMPELLNADVAVELSVFSGALSLPGLEVGSFFFPTADPEASVDFGDPYTRNENISDKYLRSYRVWLEFIPKWQMC